MKGGDWGPNDTVIALREQRRARVKEMEKQDGGPRTPDSAASPQVTWYRREPRAGGSAALLKS
jgi:hypothetical protein